MRQYNTITARTPFSTLITGFDVFVYPLFEIKSFPHTHTKKKWLSMCQRLRLRGISRRALPAPAAAAAQRLRDVSSSDDDDVDSSDGRLDDLRSSGPSSSAGDVGE